MKLKPSEVLKKYGWIQGKSGNPTEGYCIIGALYTAFPGHSTRQINLRVQKFKAVGCAIDPIKPNSWELDEWNDTPGRTKRQVLAVLRKAGL